MELVLGDSFSFDLALAGVLQKFASPNTAVYLAFSYKKKCTFFFNIEFVLFCISATIISTWDFSDYRGVVVEL